MLTEDQHLARIYRKKWHPSVEGPAMLSTGSKQCVIYALG